MYGLGNLSGGGGAERFFSDLHSIYLNFENKLFKPFFIIDKNSVSELNNVGKLKGVKKLIYFKIYSNRIKSLLEITQLFFIVIFYRIKIIHIPLYNLSYLPLLGKLKYLPAIFKPKLIINIVNCYAADALIDHKNTYHSSMKNTYNPLFSKVKVDGYFCWNKNFEDYLNNTAILNYKPKKIQSITSRFSDVSLFYPEKNKNNWIVFASRLDDQKHPEWLLEAIKLISDDDKAILKNWKFKICGNGPLRDSLIDYAKKNNILEFIEFVIEGEMHKILNFSKIYVSCQDYDNFPSLSMTEAMAAGNAIIARNVGQTDLFVKENYNGLLLSPDSVTGLKLALLDVMNNSDKLENMGNQSVKLVRDTHNFQNFINQLESFWNEISKS